MSEPAVKRHATIRIMQEVPLAELLRRARGSRSLREMARLTGLAVTSIKLLEDGETRLPAPETMPLLSEAYGLALDDLARAAYGVLFEEVPEASDDTPTLEDGAPPDSTAAWSQPGRPLRRALAPTS